MLVDVRRELAEAAAKVELGLGLGERARIGLARRGERRADKRRHHLGEHLQPTSAQPKA